MAASAPSPPPLARAAASGLVFGNSVEANSGGGFVHVLRCQQSPLASPIRWSPDVRALHRLESVGPERRRRWLSLSGPGRRRQGHDDQRRRSVSRSAGRSSSSSRLMSWRNTINGANSSRRISGPASIGAQSRPLRLKTDRSTAAPASVWGRLATVRRVARRASRTGPRIRASGTAPMARPRTGAFTSARRPTTGRSLHAVSVSAPAGFWQRAHESDSGADEPAERAHHRRGAAVITHPY